MRVHPDEQRFYDEIFIGAVIAMTRERPTWSARTIVSNAAETATLSIEARRRVIPESTKGVVYD